MTNISNEVQFAKPEDIPQIVALGYKEFEENGFPSLGIEIDFNKLMPFITDLVLNHVVLVKRNKENSKLIDGVVLFQISPTWFSSTPMLNSVFMYVKPEYRDIKIVRNLLNVAKEYGIMNKLSIVFGLTTKKDVEKKRKLFEHLGFEDWGSSLIWTYKEG